MTSGVDSERGMRDAVSPRMHWLRRPVACGVLVLLGAAATSAVHGQSMDPVLSRLRIVSGRGGCLDARDFEYCANQEHFERLSAELGVAIAPPLGIPAASVGSSGFALAIDTTWTSVDANAAHWRNGASGDPSPVIGSTRATMRKGLPLGLEVGASVGRGHATSLWSLGVALKWAIIEGFHSGAGALPDVALQVTTTRGFGHDDLALSAHSADLLLSKSFHLGRGYRLMPTLGTQLLFIHAQSGMVDLTPGPDPTSDPPQTAEEVDAFGACSPTQRDGDGVPLECAGTGQDFANNVQFDSVAHTRLRLFVGGQLERGPFRLSAALGFDLLAPALAATRASPAETSPSLLRHVAFTVAGGLAF